MTVLVCDFLDVLEKRAPAGLAQPGDNSGLLVGDAEAPVCRVLAALELTEPVFSEALVGGYDTILTHHPLLYAPVRSLVQSHPREALLRGVVAGGMTLIACHTNLDAAAGGLADIAGEALGLREMVPLEAARAGWYKLVGFVPPEALDTVAAAVFAAGAGRIGEYEECAFDCEGTGWFTPGMESRPSVGEVGSAQRVPETRWETVVSQARLAPAVRDFVEAHPYEEPVLDVYPLDTVLSGAGLGRVGTLPEEMPLQTLARRVVETFEVGGVVWSGDEGWPVARVGIFPGSGRGAIEAARGRCDVLVTGDLSYHDADKAAELGLALVNVPHGDLEWWAFRRWASGLGESLVASEVTVSVSQRWRSPWSQVTTGGCAGSGGDDPVAGRDEEGIGMSESGTEPGERPGRVRVWIDGGSRGNPGPAAIGVVAEDGAGGILHTISEAIGVATNNVAEYRALLAGLEWAEGAEAREVEVVSDSELLVRQMRGEYRVKNQGLQPLHSEAMRLAGTFLRFSIRHVRREYNADADALVNQALDEQ